MNECAVSVRAVQYNSLMSQYRVCWNYDQCWVWSVTPQWTLPSQCTSWVNSYINIMQIPPVLNSAQCNTQIQLYLMQYTDAKKSLLHNAIIIQMQTTHKTIFTAQYNIQLLKIIFNYTMKYSSTMIQCEKASILKTNPPFLYTWRLENPLPCPSKITHNFLCVPLNKQ